MSEVVRLNIGGTLHTSTVTTLLGPRAADSMLERLVSLHVAAAADPAPAGEAASVMPASQVLDGALFIDRDGASFRHVLNYLRDGNDAVLPAQPDEAARLLREAAYYQLPGLVALLEQHTRKEEWKARRETDVQQAVMQSQAATASAARALLQSLESHLEDWEQRVKEQAGHEKQLLRLAGETKDLLDEVRTYCCPKMLYHTGKRGGPNYSRPRNLAEDIAEAVGGGE